MTNDLSICIERKVRQNDCNQVFEAVAVRNTGRAIHDAELVSAFYTVESSCAKS